MNCRNAVWSKMQQLNCSTHLVESGGTCQNDVRGFHLNDSLTQTYQVRSNTNGSASDLDNKKGSITQP